MLDEASGLAAVGPVGDGLAPGRRKVVTVVEGALTCGEGTLTCGEGDVGIERFPKVGNEPLEAPRLIVIGDDGATLGAEGPHGSMTTRAGRTRGGTPRTEQPRD